MARLYIDIQPWQAPEQVMNTGVVNYPFITGLILELNPDHFLRKSVADAERAQVAQPELVFSACIKEVTEVVTFDGTIYGATFQTKEVQDLTNIRALCALGCLNYISSTFSLDGSEAFAVETAKHEIVEILYSARVGEMNAECAFLETFYED